VAAMVAPDAAELGRDDGGAAGSTDAATASAAPRSSPLRLLRFVSELPPLDLTTSLLPSAAAGLGGADRLSLVRAALRDPEGWPALTLAAAVAAPPQRGGAAATKRLEFVYDAGAEAWTRA
jgi:hypothetical protein